MWIYQNLFIYFPVEGHFRVFAIRKGYPISYFINYHRSVIDPVTCQNLGGLVFKKILLVDILTWFVILFVFKQIYFLPAFIYSK